jgi:hypothetical protein
MNNPYNSDPNAYPSRLYALLVKNKMGAPALSVIGMGMGVWLVEMTRVTPSPYDEHLGWVGLRITDFGAIVLVVTMTAYGYFWIRFVSKKKSF